MSILKYNTCNILTNIDAEHKLFELNLNSKNLTQICLQGVLARSNCTDYNTKGGAGFLQWDNTVKSLREYFCGKYWEKYEHGGLEGIISSDKTVRILPSSGNNATGNPKQPASNKNPKGINMIRLVEKYHQYSLFEDFSKQIDYDNYETYVLLYYNNIKELKIELSKPAMIRNGKIVAWDERIILEPYSLDNTPVTCNNKANENYINIPVVRKHM